MIQIEYGERHCDATVDYIITTDCVTVGEFIDEWIKEHPMEWGFFGIDSKYNHFLGSPHCEYRYGVLVSDPLPEPFLKAKIKKVTGDGGYTNSDFLFEV